MGFRTTRLIVKLTNKFKQICFVFFFVLYEILVEFNKETFEISENKITIGINSRPMKGEANKEIIKKLAKHFGVSTSKIQIKTGHKSKNKIIEIQH